MSGKIQVVSVVNDYETFKRCVILNDFVNQYDVTFFDNTRENISIAARYNTFIDKNINANSDFWVIFMHQDFIFYEDPYEKLQYMSKVSVYGPVGIKNRTVKLLFLPEISLPMRCLVGQIMQGENQTEKLVGRYADENVEVKTLDCCCVIVHSKLIYEKKLRFDAVLDFHMYVEDFCISAEKKGIKSKIIQYKCRHLSAGSRNKRLYECANYIKAKHKILRINSTCHI